jgi:diguanylate cyclase (GGDEF)-like protein
MFFINNFVNPAMMNKSIKRHKAPQILIVSEKSNEIQRLNEILQKQYKVYFANTAEKAIDITNSKNLDLILLNTLMQEPHADELCEQLQTNENFQNIPILFLISNDETENKAKVFTIGASDYITWPFNATLVEARVRNYIELKQQRDFIKNLSSLDGLTRVANRSRFEEILYQEWWRAVRYNTELSLLMIDIDYFRQYNENYGYLAGDNCLKTIASKLERELNRPSDLLARYEGNEFVSILPETDREGALHVANTLIKSIAALNIPHKSSATADHVTLSIGVASIVPSVLFHTEDLITLAKNSLYEAKYEGRNKCKTNINQLINIEDGLFMSPS